MCTYVQPPPPNTQPFAKITLLNSSKMIMASQSLRHGVEHRCASIHILGPQHSGLEEICDDLLYSDKIEHLTRTYIRDTCQHFQTSDSNESSDDISSGNPVYSKYLDNDRLRIPDQGLDVLVKRDLISAMERWATKHGELKTDDHRNDTGEKQTSGSSLKSVISKVNSVVKKLLQPEQARIQKARGKAWATYLVQRRTAENTFAEMRRQLDTLSLEVDGNDAVAAVEKICDKWKTMQNEYGDA